MAASARGSGRWALLLVPAFAVAAVFAGCAAVPPACDFAITGLPADAAPPEVGQPMPTAGVSLVGPGEVDWAGSSLGTDDTGSTALTVRLAPPAASRVAAWTETNTGAYIAIGLNGTVMSGPVIQAPISGEEIQITSGSLDDAPPFAAVRDCLGG
jgi:hypothetical protein